MILHFTHWTLRKKLSQKSKMLVLCKRSPSTVIWNQRQWHKVNDFHFFSFENASMSQVFWPITSIFHYHGTIYHQVLPGVAKRTLEHQKYEWNGS